MKKFIFILVLLVAIIAILGGGSWLVKNKGNNKGNQGTPSSLGRAFVALAAEKRLINPIDLIYQPISIVPKVPLLGSLTELTKISNWSRAIKYLSIDNTISKQLEDNKFVVSDLDKVFTSKFLSIGSVYADRFEMMYSYIQNLEHCEDRLCSTQEKTNGLPVPIIITTDSVLHFYHLIYESLLMRMERDIFFSNLWNLDKALLDNSLKIYETNNDSLVKEAAKRNIAYFATALELLKPKDDQILTSQKIKEKGEDNDIYWSIQNKCGSNSACIREYIETNLPNEFSRNDQTKYQFEVPEIVKNEVAEEIKLIEGHKGWDYSPVFVYKEDYSQYVPRGHYTKGEKLKNYFQAMMWHGRMTMLIKGTEALTKGTSACSGDLEAIISKEDAQIQTLQASLIAQAFKSQQTLQDQWKKIYVITGFMVGIADDLGPYEYVSILDSTLNNQEITSSQVEQIQQALLKLPSKPKIYSGLGACQLVSPYDSQQAQKLLEATTGFRLMGQRYTLDSALFSNIVTPYSGTYKGDAKNLPFTAVGTEAGRIVRGFPRGLDIMAILGSQRASYWLEELGDANYTDYQSQFDKIKSEIDSLEFKDWTQTLYTSWLYTLKPLLEQFGKGYPDFMQTTAYQDKSLTTALASWAQLRHDTILYTKQSYSMAEGAGPGEELPSRGYVEPVPEFYNRLLLLNQMSEKGIKDLLTEQEWEKLGLQITMDKFSDVLQKLLTISQKELQNETLTQEEYELLDEFGDVSTNLIRALITEKGSVEVVKGMEDILKTTIVADVHTDGNSSKVLEEGVGKIKLMLAVYRLPDGRLMLGAGPVFSYYEFKQPMGNRLTDEAWREMLNTNPPAEPEWVKTFSISK